MRDRLLKRKGDFLHPPPPHLPARRWHFGGVPPLPLVTAPSPRPPTPHPRPGEGTQPCGPQGQPGQIPPQLYGVPSPLLRRGSGYRVDFCSPGIITPSAGRGSFSLPPENQSSPPEEPPRRVAQSRSRSIPLTPFLPFY